MASAQEQIDIQSALAAANRAFDAANKAFDMASRAVDTGTRALTEISAHTRSCVPLQAEQRETLREIRAAIAELHVRIDDVHDRITKVSESGSRAASSVALAQSRRWLNAAWGAAAILLGLCGFLAARLLGLT